MVRSRPQMSMNAAAPRPRADETNSGSPTYFPVEILPSRPPLTFTTCMRTNRGWRIGPNSARIAHHRRRILMTFVMRGKATLFASRPLRTACPTKEWTAKRTPTDAGTWKPDRDRAPIRRRYPAWTASLASNPDSPDDCASCGIRLHRSVPMSRDGLVGESLESKSNVQRELSVASFRCSVC